jgi:subtilisin family serine protease
MVVLQKQTDRGGEPTIRLAGPVVQAVAKRLEAELGLKDVQVFGNLGQFAATMDLKMVLKVLEDPQVAFVSPVQTYSVPLPEGTEGAASWGTDRVNQRDLPLDGNDVMSSLGDGVHIAIIDTGIVEHPDYEGRLSADCFSATGEGCRDNHGHGTHCAGIAGGTTFGVAKGVTLHASQVLNRQGSGTTDQVVAGIDWTVGLKRRLGVPVIGSMSLGGPADPALDQAVCDAIDAGVQFAIAAGNDYGDDAREASPARVIQAVTVAASTRTDAAADFSNGGPVVDLWAPGRDIISARPGGGSTVMSGTSMATPHVAGGMAIALAGDPTLTPAEVARKLTLDATVGKITGGPDETPNLLLYAGAE